MLMASVTAHGQFHCQSHLLGFLSLLICVCMCAGMHGCTHRGQTRASDSLKLEFKAVVSQATCVGDWRSGHLEEQQVLFTMGASPLVSFLKSILVVVKHKG